MVCRFIGVSPEVKKSVSPKVVISWKVRKSANPKEISKFVGYKQRKTGSF